MHLKPILTFLVGAAAASLMAAQPTRDADTVAAEHGAIGLKDERPDATHTNHPDAQWYPDAGFGLFLHWGISSVRAMGISWPMIPGRPLANRHITDPAERARIIRDQDFNLDGKPPAITPNEYFSMARDFNPQRYDPDKWFAAAKAAGFQYVVLTTRHHEGFSLWPSAYGDFDTRNYMGGRDLLKPYVEAARRQGLKVGFYYSPPDWYFDRDYMTFLYYRAALKNPEFPPIGPDLRPRTATHTAEEIAAHQRAYGEKVRGQVEELLTRYGKIDLLWFDGRPNIPNGDKVISQARIRELQPGIVINPRLHGKGDFITYERTLPAERPAYSGWSEFCDPWTGSWSYQDIPFRAPAYVLGQLANCRAWGINYLLGLGPTKEGELSDGAYENMAIVAGWMRTRGESVAPGVKPLPPTEKASVLATAMDRTRYLFVLRKFKDNGRSIRDQLPATAVALHLTGVPRPVSVKLLGSSTALAFDYDASTQEVSVSLPAEQQSDLVDVVRVDLPASPAAQRPAPYELPPPTQADVRYGPHERQVLDFWQAKGREKTPLLFYIHGGAWNAGDKSTIVRGIDAGRLLAAGISVVSINYRYIRQAEADGVRPPVAGTLGDAARALQFVRSKASEWRIDPTRIAAMGGSAGGFSSLWLLLHDDLADPKSADPIARESTRLYCAAVDSAQTTLDPQQILEWIPNTQGYGAHALGLKPRNSKESVMPLYLESREKLLPWIKEYSPYYLATRDDPPFLLFYKSNPDMGKPARDVRHTANYGAEFARHCQEVGIDCEILYPAKPGYEKDAIVKYLIRMLTKTPAP